MPGRARTLRDEVAGDLPVPARRPAAALLKKWLPDRATRQLVDDAPAPLAAAIGHALAHSTYLRSLMAREPERLARLTALGPAQLARQAIALASPLEQVTAAEGSDVTETMERLRLAKADHALAVAIADIAGEWPVEQVCASLSDFAIAACKTALLTACAQYLDAPDTTGFIVLALGKLGGHALNYSSDIDLILLYDRATLAQRIDGDVERKAVRIAQRFVAILGNINQDGYVQRVDLRLRPDPYSTPIILPLEAAEAYYHSEAMAWERSAFIKARTIAGDIDAGQAFLDRIAPFIWRRAKDFTVVNDIREMSALVQDHFDLDEPEAKGFDIKRGKGGIREVEFFVQIHQLIFGGRDDQLRSHNTLTALESLLQAGLVQQDVANQLRAAYRFLRGIENRLQMLEDAQTHSLPDQSAALATFATFAGYASTSLLQDAISARTATVNALFSALFNKQDNQQQGVPAVGEALAGYLSELGYQRPREISQALGRWRTNRYRALRTEQARQRLERFLPQLLQALAASQQPDEALFRFDGFLAGLPSGVQLFALFEHNPELLGLLVAALTLAQPVAEELVRNPHLFDIVLDPDFFAPLPQAEDLHIELSVRTARRSDTEAVLDEVRHFVRERRFQLALQLLQGKAAAPEAQTGFTRLADLSVETLAQRVATDFAGQFGRIVDGELLILALGRYGGGALSGNSDLDLIFLHTGAHDGESKGGARSLPASLYFNRLSQRIVTALTVPTGAGELFEIDTRLRPCGTQGPLCVSLAGFAEYERKEAWTWEHMALLRARPVFGSQIAQDAALAVIHAELTRKTDWSMIRAAALEMRQDADSFKPGSGPWDVKLGKGGLVDIEYIIHVLQLRYGHDFPDLITPALPDAIARLAHHDLLPVAQSAALGEALALLDATQTILRVGYAAPPQKLEPRGFGAVLANQLQRPDLASVSTAIAAARESVGAVWGEVFGRAR